MKRMSTVLGLILIAGISIAGCGTDTPRENKDSNTSGVIKISAEEAKDMMDRDKIILVDVRTEEEYSDAHMEGALLLPIDEIKDQAAAVIPDKENVYLLYCRSGSRSRQAADMLVELGYENIYDFGGIIDWPYETVSGID